MAHSVLKKSGKKQPVAAILTIGNELLTGRTVNTNASFLGKELTQMGFQVLCQQVCPDNQILIHESLSRFNGADLLIVTGGLGPTPDDLTREAIASFFSVPLLFSSRQFAAMKKIYQKLKKKLPALSRKEAYYPANSKPLVNRFGIALGFWIQNKHQLIVALPGVPTELQKMFIHDVVPLLTKKNVGLSADLVLAVSTVGISEPRIIEKLGVDFFNQSFEFGIYPSEGETQICIRSSSKKVIALLKKKISLRLSGCIYSWDNESLAELIGRLLLSRRKNLSVAESCTGGSLAFSWTRHPGASQYFRGGLTAYDSFTKKKLGVSARTLNRYGEISAEVAASLAQSVCYFLNTDYGIGVTGIAGPMGALPKKPVGLVYISIAQSAGDILTEKFLFWGNRDQIQRKAVAKAQEMLWRLLLEK